MKKYVECPKPDIIVKYTDRNIANQIADLLKVETPFIVNSPASMISGNLESAPLSGKTIMLIVDEQDIVDAVYWVFDDLNSLYIAGASLTILLPGTEDNPSITYLPNIAMGAIRSLVKFRNELEHALETDEDFISEVIDLTGFYAPGTVGHTHLVATQMHHSAYLNSLKVLVRSSEELMRHNVQILPSTNAD